MVLEVQVLVIDNSSALRSGESSFLCPKKFCENYMTQKNIKSLTIRIAMLSGCLQFDVFKFNTTIYDLAIQSDIHH